MRIMIYLMVAGVSAVVTFAFAYLVLKLSHRYKLYPKVRERDVHTRPTPRLGGLAMFIGIVVAVAVASQIPMLSLVFSEERKVWAVLGAAVEAVEGGFVVVGVGVEGLVAAQAADLVLDGPVHVAVLVARLDGDGGPEADVDVGPALLHRVERPGSGLVRVVR